VKAKLQAWTLAYWWLPKDGNKPYAGWTTIFCPKKDTKKQAYKAMQTMCGLENLPMAAVDFYKGQAKHQYKTYEIWKTRQVNKGAK